MRAGHSSHKASLNRFNFLSTAECECGDGLQTEEHIFWDCKQHKRIPKVCYRALKAIGKKDLCEARFFVKRISEFIKNERKY
jgi:hypothetical protein